MISIVVPCYNEEAALPYFFQEIYKVLQQMAVDYELIMLDDGSSDNTLQILEAEAQQNKRVVYISFSRNFGKEAAIYAGIQHAKGDYVVIMDADLQDPPELLPQLYQAVAQEGYDAAATRRVSRKGEPVIRSFFARQFYKLMKHISQAELVDGARDYRLMNRKFVNALLELKEYNRFSKGLFGWVGFKTKWLEFENVERVAGETKWSFWSLLLYAIEGIVAFSTLPLILATVVGLLCCLLAFGGVIFIVLRKLLFGDPVQGWASSMCIVLAVGGIQLFCTGILGQYLAKTYLETKKRPIYIIAESNIDEVKYVK